MQKPHKKFVSIIALVIGLAAAQAQAGSLEDAMVKAYRGNPDLAASLSSLRRADETVAIVLGEFRPGLSLTLNHQSIEGEARPEDIFPGINPTEASIDTATDPTTISISASQNFYAGGGSTARLDGAEQLASAERYQVLLTEQQVLASVVSAYASVWRDRRIVGLAVENQQRAQRQRDITGKRFRAREVTRSDMALADARLLGAAADLEQARAALNASTSAYTRIVGEPPAELEEPSVIEDLPASLDEARALSTSHPSIKLSEFNLGASRANRRSQWADLLPSVDASLSYNYTNDPSPNLAHQRSVAATVNVTVPLYSGGAERAEIRQSAHETQRQLRLLESAERRVREDVDTNWNNLLAAKSTFAAFERTVEANELALETVQIEAFSGLRTVQDILDTETALFSAQVNAATAFTNIVTTSYNLKASVGKLQATEIGLPVETYDLVTYGQQARRNLFGTDIIE